MTKEQCPKGWAVEPLRNVAEIQRKSVSAAKIDSGTIYVGLEHIDGSGSFINPPTVDNGELASTKFIFGPEHLLYGKLRPYLKKIVRPSFSGVCSTDILPILPDKEVLDRGYLYYYLRQTTQINLATARATGANLPRLSPKTLSEFPIFLPSLPEQKRIAAILDKADGIRRKRQEAIALADTFLSSVFLKMFGDPVTNPMGWDEVELGEIASDVKYGTSTKCIDEALEGMIPVLRIPNILNGAINTDDLKYANIPDKELPKLKLKKNDILFVRTNGNPEYVARCAVFHDELTAAFASYLIRVRLKDQYGGLSSMIAQMLSLPSYRAEIAKETRTTAGNYNINSQAIRKLKIVIPSKEIIREYEQMSNKTVRFLPQLYESKSKSEILFASLQQRAFRGDL